MHRVLRTTALAVLVAANPCRAQDVRVRGADQRPSAANLKAVTELARAAIARLAPEFPGTPRRPITIVVHTDSTSVGTDQLAGLQAGVPGFARLQKDEIHVVLAHIGSDPPNDLRTTVDHELVHILLDQFAGPHGILIPRWFHEGLAQVLAGGTYLGVQEEDLAYRVQTRSYHPFHTLRESFPHANRNALALAYGQSFSFVSFLRRKVGMEPLLAAARECGPDLTFRAAVARRLRRGLTEFESEWRDYILYESGAGYRTILRNCFMILVVAAVVPLLALAVARRRNREEALKQRMRRDEAEQAAAEAEQAAADAQRAAAEAELTDLGETEDYDEDDDPWWSTESPPEYEERDD